MTNTPHNDNSELPEVSGTYISSNYATADKPNQNDCIDMKWPNCNTGTKQILDTFTAMSSSRHEGSLAQTVSERWSKEERWFVGRSQED